MISRRFRKVALLTVLISGCGVLVAPTGTAAAYANAIPSTVIRSIPVAPGGGQFRVGWFIKKDEVFGLSGDDRGFDPGMGPEDNRVYLEVDYERGLLMVHVNPTCDPEGNCTDAVAIADHFTVKRGRGTLVEVRIDVPNSRRSIAGRPRITAEMQFYLLGEKPCVIGLFDRFPSVEIYHDQNGSTTSVWRRSESRFLGPAGLSPLTVVNMNSCD